MYIDGTGRRAIAGYFAGEKNMWRRASYISRTCCFPKQVGWMLWEMAVGEIAAAGPRLYGDYWLFVIFIAQCLSSTHIVVIVSSCLQTRNIKEFNGKIIKCTAVGLYSKPCSQETITVRD